MAPPARPVRERLLATIRVDPSGCWIWLGKKDKNGYGIIGIRRGKQYRAHRIAYETFRGPIPESILVCHKCDEPSCINPRHLFLGTAKANTADMLQKGRANRLRGEAHPSAKLENRHVAKIRELRATGMKLLSIANRFGVTFQHVSLICRGKTRT